MLMEEVIKKFPIYANKRPQCIHYALRFLKLSGWDFLKMTALDKLEFTTFMFFFAIIYGLIIYDFRIEGDQLDKMAAIFEGKMIFNEVITRLLILILYRKSITTAILELREFWDYNNENIGKKQKEEHKKFIDNIEKLCANFGYIIMVTYVAFISKPFVTDDGELPERIFVPFLQEFPPIKWILYFIECIVGFWFLSIIYGTDVIFVSICVHTILQFKLLQSKFRDVKSSKTIPKLIQRHWFLIIFVKRLRGIFSLLFACQIVITTLTICMELYLTTMSTKMTIGYAIKNFVFCLSLTWQLAFYCMPATEVSIQAMELANAIYESEWYNADPKFRKYVVFIIMNAQKRLTFTAGGLHVISRETFTEVFRTSVSFFTMMRTIQQK